MRATWKACLQRTVRVVCEVMETKASSLRLIDDERDELVIKAVYNLSAQYIGKGPIRLSQAVIDQVAHDFQGIRIRPQHGHRSPRAVSAGSEARGDRFHAFGGDAVQGQGRRRSARLHRAGADVHPVSDRPDESRRRRRRRPRSKTPALSARPCSRRRWSGRCRWPRRCSIG